MMYPYGFPPPPFYGYQPPQYGPGPTAPPSPSDLERGMKIAIRMRLKEERKKEKIEEAKNKQKADEKKKAEESKGRSLLSVEWFILGILAYPFVGPAYNYLIKLSH